MVLVLQRITLSMDDRSGFKRLFWKSLGEPSPACEEKEDELKQASRGSSESPGEQKPMHHYNNPVPVEVQASLQ